MHVHLREPGFEYKETIETGCRAAVAGGFTAVACMPNTKPPIDTPEIVAYILRRARAVDLCRVYPIAAITEGRRGERVVDMKVLMAAGAVAFSDDGDGVEREDVMRAAFEQAAGCGALLIQHCEFKRLSAGGVMHTGPTAKRLGLPGIDPRAEEEMIERDLDLLRQIVDLPLPFRERAGVRVPGPRYHVAHISTARSVELVRQAKLAGLPVTTEVCPHHLVLTDEACATADPNFKMHPPLRSAEDVAACVTGIVDGTIDCIVTDHAPHTDEEKALGFLKAPFGIIGLETAVGIAAKALVETGKLGWPTLIDRMSSAPARVLGLPVPTLAIGQPFDVTLIDASTHWIVDPRRFESKCRNTPFGGERLRVRAIPVASKMP
jgi:dihydroorotase